MKINEWVIGGSILLLLAGTLAFAGYKIYFPQTGYAPYQPPTDLNVFEGRVTNVKVSPGTIEGISAYDRNCIGNVVMECDGGIKTDEYGILNFHYRHEMAIQPCIHMFGPERMIVEILDSDGNARVTRTIDLSDMAGHHG